MKDKILALISQISKKSLAEIDEHYSEKGLWDSISHVELIIMLETEFNIFFEEKEIGEMKSPELVVAYTTKKISEL
jgi:acyl carrier protein